jgi:transcription-repair coupling factor
VSGGVFSDDLINKFIRGFSVSGMTWDALAIFLYETTRLLKKNIFIQLDDEVRALSFYRVCNEYSNSCFLYFPCVKTRDVVPGFDVEDTRYRKESILGLMGGDASCCILTKRSLYELSIPQSIESGVINFNFCVGDKSSPEKTIDKLGSAGYERSLSVFDPGHYSSRGDVLDIYPIHFRNPFRISFNFDRIETISIFDPLSQLTIKSIKTLLFKDFNVGSHVVNNISLMGLHPGVDICSISKNETELVLSHLEEKGRIELDFSPVVLSDKSKRLRLKKVGRLSKNVKNFFFVGGEIKKNSVYAKNIGARFVSGSIGRGFLSNELSLLVVSERVLFYLEKPEDKWQNIERNNGQFINRGALSGLIDGDFLVHRSFGIGIYRGVVFQNSENGEKESLEIEYDNNSRVFVSLDQLSRVHRYVGSRKTPKISSLGSKRWVSELRRTRDAVSSVAKELVELYSEKNKERPFSYVKENDIDNMLSDSFSFIETPDQKDAISDVLSDMNGKKPLDRLICGDVGFGKTEVAVRAIFKAFLSDRVSVLLCPTTILADQHYITCKERLGPLGVSIDLLSRFKSKLDQKKTLTSLKNKKIDVLIGTHRVLSGDVKIPGLGLLIIDEEHRFGVGHKEKIRSFKKHLDVLTLTATPIPRTLQQSLVGLRDLSTVLTPPKSRRPIFTTVQYFDWDLVFSYIETELERGGQTYFLHNDIKSIPYIAEKIRSRFSGAATGEVSGKMPSGILETTVLAFFRGEIDILVCTTIIESGLDVTNANCIIINNAQNFGLSQLYQIRGRVGRGTKQAHCLLLVPHRPLEKDAHRRLKTIEQNSSLGSGYNISMKDLEIRGAGSLFGYKQSGHISAVGFEMYCEILKSEIDRVTGRDNADDMPSIHLSEPADISDAYIIDRSFRIDYYYKISRIVSLDDLDIIEKELLDQFGPLPMSTQMLLNVARARVLFRGVPIKNIYIGDGSLVFALSSLGRFNNLDKLFNAVESFKHGGVKGYRYEKTGDGKLKIIFTTSGVESSMELLLSSVCLFSFDDDR